MKNILNKRLQTLSAFLKDNDVVIDIGCDHALLGIYLVLNHKNIKVISSDINKKPLEKAKENIAKYHLEDKIELRLGNGLDVMSSDINTIVISGMGGITIKDILKRISNYPNVYKLVLSPNSDLVLVRKEICKLGFRLKDEKMVLENNKYYSIMEFIKGKEKTSSYFGKLDLNDKIVYDYYVNIYQKNKKILINLFFFNKIKKYSLIKENMLIKKMVKRYGKSSKSN